MMLNELIRKMSHKGMSSEAIAVLIDLLLASGEYSRPESS